MTYTFQSLASLFEQQVEQAPEKIAVSCGIYAINYQEINEKANQIAHYLRRIGIGPEKRVALYLDRSVELIIVLLSVIKSGGAYVPLDSNTPVERVKLMLMDCQPDAIITQESLYNDINIPAKKLPTKNLIKIDTDWPVIGKEPKHNSCVNVTADTLLYVIYTSGSTGQPKAVQGTYRGIINRLHWVWNEYPFTEHEVSCQRISISFVDHVAEIFAPLLKKTPLIILPEPQANDAEELVLALSRNKITRINVAPSLLKSMLCVRQESVFHLPYLKYVFCSGEALSTALAGLFYQRFKSSRLINIYGATEVSADASWYEVKRLDVDQVLSYFSKSLDDFPQNHDTLPSDITTPNMPYDALAVRFKKTTMAKYPISLSEYFQWFDKNVMPYSINTASPLYIGHMTSALPDFVHDMSKLISRMNQNLVKMETAKSLIFLEREALAMLHRCFYGFSDAFYNKYVQKVNRNLGLVTTGGTISNITALMIARNRALAKLAGKAWAENSIYSVLQASGYRDLIILGSRLMHYSMKKAVSVLGLGVKNIVHVDSASDGALDATDLSKKLQQCQRDGLLVFSIVGIAGATETGHLDPLEQMADIAEAHDIFFHVDAAWGGAGLFSSAYRKRFKGIERAQSVTFCAHKQLYLPQGVSICLFRDPEELHFGEVTAAYQATPDSYDVGRFSIEGSRSAMALLIHAALQVIGQKGFEALFNASIDKAVFFANIIDALDCFELMFTPPLNIVNYRYIPARYRKKLQKGALSHADNQAINNINQQIQETQFEQGSTFVSKTTLTNTRYGNKCPTVVFRVIMANPLTTQADIFQVLENQIHIANEICDDQNHYELNEANNTHNISLANAFSESVMLKTELEGPLVPIGKALPNCQMYILNKQLQVVPDGEIGDIYIAGIAVSRGYFHATENHEKQNHEKQNHKAQFIADPFAKDGSHMFRSGDRGKRLEDGNISYCGRNDDIVKIDGYRIALSEVESILQEIANIKHCAVTVHHDDNGTKYLAANLELDTINKGNSMNNEDWLKTIIESAQIKLQAPMLPREFRVLDQIPLTLSGKLDRKALHSKAVKPLSRFICK